jgi:FixJ family two-component response regulator
VTATPTVYVIDDDLSVRRAIARLLRVAGHKVVTCDSADAFLALKTIPRPACLVVDVRMPNLTGFDLQQTLRLEGRNLPIVLITGHGHAAMAARAAATGALAFLVKPFPDGVLLDAVQTGLQMDQEEQSRSARTDDT